MIKAEEVYKIGRIGKPHGVKGELQLQFDDDIFDRVDADYLVLSIDGILVPFFMEEYRFRSDSVALMKFEDIDTQERARELVGCDVFFPRELAEEGTEDVSMSQIVGFKIRDAHNNKVVGRILGIDTSTVNTLFELETEDGKEVLLPANDDLIRDINPSAQEITMELPDGILDLD